MAESSVVPILEIKDEFATCEICLEYFDERYRSPRILPCHHTFCCQCLESIFSKSQQTVTCPNCRFSCPVQDTVKATFPQNKVVINVLEFITMKNKLGDIMCRECPNRFEATARCLDCREYLCESCKACHEKLAMLKGHKIVLISDLVNKPDQEYFQQQKEMCKKHQNLKLDLFCRTCSTAVCSLCTLVSHRLHDILDLEDVYQAKKNQITAALADLKTSEEKSEVYTRRLDKQNKTLGYMKPRLLQDIDSSYEKCITMLSDKRKQLKEDVILNVEEQQADRNEQMEMVVQCNDRKTQHSLYCQQALSYAQAVHFIEMSEDLEKETRRLVEMPQLLDMKIEEVEVDLDTFDQVCKIVDKTTDGIVFYSKDKDEDVMKKILFSVDGQAGYYRTLLLPTIEFDEDKLNCDRCSITEDGQLVNEFVLSTLSKNSPSSTSSVEGLVSSISGVEAILSNTSSLESVVSSTSGVEAILSNTSSLESLLSATDNDTSLLSSTSGDETPARLTRLYGTTSRMRISGPGSRYWQLDISNKVLESAEIGLVAAQAGICFEDECDDEIQITDHKNSWCVSVNSCKFHNRQCFKVHTRSTCVYDRPMANFEPNAVLNLSVGFLLDSEKNTLHIIDVNTNSCKLLHSITGVDTSRALVPVFGVYNETDFEVKLKLVSDIDVSMESKLLQQLSLLMQP